MDRKTIRVDAKAKARTLMSTSRPSPVFVACVVIIFGIIVSMLTGRITGMDTYYEKNMKMLNTIAQSEVITSDQLDILLEQSNQNYSNLISQQSPLGSILIFAMRVMLIMLNLGFTIFCVNTVRNKKPEFANLLDGFQFFIKYVILSFLIGLFVFLWSLLLIVPGIIASYRYRMATYIMLDNPDLTPWQCIKKSKEMMYGRKQEMFVLDLSFIGWKILELLPGIGYFTQVWATPYISLTDVIFYERYRGEDRTATENANYNI